VGVNGLVLNEQAAMMGMSEEQTASLEATLLHRRCGPVVLVEYFPDSRAFWRGGSLGVGGGIGGVLLMGC
jgi:hypothetical protein